MGLIKDLLSAKRQEIQARASSKVASSTPVRAARSVGSAARLVGEVARALTYNANSPSAGADFQRISKTPKRGDKAKYHKDILRLVRFCEQVTQNPNQEHRDVVDGHALDYRPNIFRFGDGPAVLLTGDHERRLANFAAALLEHGVKVEELTPTKQRGKYFVLVDLKTGAQPERQ